MKKSGDKWEIIAIEYLTKHWYKILETNFKFSIVWEIDIVAYRDEKVYFIEVKYREWDSYGTWEESITKTKLKKIGKTIDYYCTIRNVNLENIQFDIIIITKLEKVHRIKHYKNQAVR